MIGAPRLLLPRPLVGRSDEGSLEERFGLLVLVRLGMAAALLAVAGLAPGQIALGLHQVALPIAAYVALTGAGALVGTRSRRAALAAHRVVLPADSLWLVLVCTPSGGARSPLVALCYLHLVAVALLVSARTGVRVALWDAALLVAVPSLGLGARLGHLLGVPSVVVPGATATAVAVVGLYALALCTAGASGVRERELRRSRQELSELAAMVALLEEATERAPALRILLERSAAALGAQRAALALRGPSSLVLGADGPLEVANAPGADTVLAEARAARSPLARRAIDPVVGPVAAALLPGARNVVMAAVGHGPDAPVLLLEHGGRAEGERVARRTLLVAAQFASHGALALGSIDLLAERARQASLDGLTGLANRRHFDASLAREVAAASRRHEPLTVALVDVDHFKAVNDRQGHLAGDEVLRRLGAVLLEASRDSDLVARYGGEEFVVILPACDAAQALGVLHRVDEALRADEVLASITVSSGVATLHEHADDAAGLVAAADEALYESKRAGRDRATVSSQRAARPLHGAGA